jgi:hypothetical protein
MGIFSLKFWQKILFCNKNKHIRSRRHAKFDGHIWVSKCKYCDLPLYRNRSRKWVLSQEEIVDDCSNVDVNN